MALPERGGLRGRLLLFGCLAALLVSGAGGWVLRQNIHATLLRGLEQRLDERAERIAASLLAAPGGSGLVPERSRNNDEFSRIFSGWYWQLEGAGPEQRSRSLWDSRLTPADASAPSSSLASLLAPGTPLRSLRGPRGEALLGLAVPVEAGGQRAMLHVYGPAAETEAELARLDRILLLTQALLILALVIATLAQVRLGLAPLRRLRAALAAVRDGSAERLGSGYGPELDPLAEEMDEVLARNARVVARARGHAADLSHALKKPLALLGGEATADGSELLRGQVAAMSRLIDRHLARAGSGAGELRRVAVAPRIAHLVALMQRLHRERGLDWQQTVPAQLHWRCEPTDLEEMLGNLLDNAGKWARSTVRVDAEAAAGELRIRIADDGPGLDDTQLEQASRRGLRFDENTEGSGLGLAIARDIAETYGGRLELGRGTLGGLEAVLVLPV